MTGLGLDLAAALAGAGAWSVHSAFAAAAPDLGTLSTSSTGSSAHQQLLDTTVVTGAMAAGVGTLLSLAARSVVPLLVALGMWAMVALLYHGVLHRTPTPAPTSSGGGSSG